MALAALFFFGCQTVRVRPDVPQGPPPRLALAEPELDLWIEGNGPAGPGEQERTLAQARAALEGALEGRSFVEGDQADAILVVREQAVAVSEGRKQAQAAAIAGIAVLLAAVGILAVASGKSGGKGGGAKVPGRATPAPARGGGAVVRGVGSVAPPRVPNGIGVRWPAPRYLPPPPRPWFDIGLEVRVGGPPAPVPMGPPPLESRLASRGFFDGHETEITLELRDPQSGETLAVVRRAAGIDPRDPAAVRAMVDGLLSALPARLPPPAFPGPAPFPEPPAAPSGRPADPPPSLPLVETVPA